MSECTNTMMRDALPELVQGDVTTVSRAALEAHLASCASCRAELEVLRAAHAVLSVTPPLDSARVAAALTQVARGRATTPARVPATHRWARTPRARVLLAAASVAAIAAASVLSLTPRQPNDAGRTAPREVAQRETVPPAREAPARATAPSLAPVERPRTEIVFGGGVADLEEAQIEALLSDLENADVLIGSEPAPVLTWLEGEV